MVEREYKHKKEKNKDKTKNLIKDKMQVIFFYISIALTVIFHFILPISTVIISPYTYIGLILIGIGLVYNFWAVFTLKKFETTYEFYDTPTTLVTSGPFSKSRNPIYLGGIVLMIGVSIFLGSLITFIFPPIVIIILHFYYIPIEEKKMEDLFGNDYLKYKKDVRRWI